MKNPRPSHFVFARSGETVRHAQHGSGDLEAAVLGGEVEVRLPVDSIGLVAVGGSNDGVDE
jgi:hypothetical protein